MYNGQRSQRVNTATGPAGSPTAAQRKQFAMPTSNHANVQPSSPSTGTVMNIMPLPDREAKEQE
eukprot:500442-Lingulodinium_polyedra.AAC.1